MTDASRRAILAGALAAPLAGGAVAVATMLDATSAQHALPSPDLMPEGEYWSRRLDAAIAELHAAAMAENAALALFRATAPQIPAEMYVTAVDRDLGIGGDALMDSRGSPRRGPDGVLLRVTDSAELRESASRLADAPAIAARLRARIAAVERYERAYVEADDAAGVPTAQEACFHARQRLIALIDQLLDGHAFPTAAVLSARGILAFAEGGKDYAFDARNRWGLRLAEVVGNVTG